MIKVGVTGGIGSGKSTVCKFLEVLGYPVYYADDRAKWITNHQEECRNRIIEEFGPNAYTDGVLNRDFMAKNVFSDSKKLETLNNIVHPLVKKDTSKWLRKHKDDKITFKEAALIFEIEGQQYLDKVIVVTADDEIRVGRVLKRDKHRNIEQVEGILASQMPQRKKEGLADFVIDNSGDKLVIPQVLNILNSITNV